jgi:hypothetical protein
MLHIWYVQAVGRSCDGMIDTAIALYCVSTADYVVYVHGSTCVIQYRGVALYCVSTADCVGPSFVCSLTYCTLYCLLN